MGDAQTILLIGAIKKRPDIKEADLFLIDWPVFPPFFRFQKKPAAKALKINLLNFRQKRIFFLKP